MHLTPFSNMLFGHIIAILGGGSNRKKYTPLTVRVILSAVVAIECRFWHSNIMTLITWMPIYVNRLFVSFKMMPRQQDFMEFFVGSLNWMWRRSLCSLRSLGDLLKISTVFTRVCSCLFICRNLVLTKAFEG